MQNKEGKKEKEGKKKREKHHTASSHEPYHELSQLCQMDLSLAKTVSTALILTLCSAKLFNTTADISS